MKRRSATQNERERNREGFDDSPDLNKTSEDGSDHLSMEHDSRGDLHV